MKRKILALIFFLLFVSCSNRPIGSPYAFGREEFVKDSMIVSNGKKGVISLFEKNYLQVQQSLISDDFVVDGDIFEICVFNSFPHPWIDYLKTQSDKNGFIVVKETLKIPYFGSVTLQKNTIEDAIEKIQKLITTEFPEAICTVQLKDRLNQRVEIQGMISRSIPLIEKNRSLYQLINHLQIGKEVSFYNSYVKRKGVILSIDLEKLILEGNLEEDLVLESCDVVYLADMRKAKIMVLGEVKKEGVVPMECSTIPLKEIIARAGGIQLSANKLFIQVIRGGMDHPKVYTLHYQDILRSPNDAMLLIQGDIVYVAATPIAEWNRLINQLLPSLTAYEFLHRGIQGVIIQ